MQFPMTGLLTGIKASKGEFEGRVYDSTTFFLAIDLNDTSSAKTLGSVSRPFKLGDSRLIEEWMGFKDKWPAGGIPVQCLFEMVASGQDKSQLVLKQIKPASNK